MAKKVNKKKAFKLRLKKQGLFNGPQAPVPPVAPVAPKPPVKPQAPVASSEPAVTEPTPQSNQDLTLEEVSALPEFAGLRANLVETLYQEGLTSQAAFGAVTEKDLLALKGVGPATLKKLKENGVTFKA